MRRAALAALASAALLAGACGDDSNRATQRRPQPSPDPEPPPPTPIPAPADDAAVPALAPLTPLETQLEPSVPAVQFLGWTEDGRRFAVRATHGYDMEELGGQNLLALYQVHDAMTGAMVESYRIRRVADDSVTDDDELSLAWSEAQPAEDWKAFRRENPLVGRDAATTHGDWTIEAVAEDEPPFESRFEVTVDESRVDLRWSDFDEERLQGPRRRPARAPRVRITARRGDDAYRLLIARPPWSYDQINTARDGGEPRVLGSIRPYWSPAGDRVLLIASYRVRGVHEEHGEMADARWLVRVLGPQIQLVDAGVGADAAHAAAARLAAAGLPVTAIIAADKPASGSRVSYRRGGRRVAERAAGQLGLSPAVDERDEPGWPTVEIVLAR